MARQGKRIRSTLLDVRVAASPHVYSRVGFIVPKHGATAVRRNRLKRILREETRLKWLGALRERSERRAIDVVVRTRVEAYRAAEGALRLEIARLAPTVHALAASPEDLPHTGADTPRRSGP